MDEIEELITDMDESYMTDFEKELLEDEMLEEL